MISRKFKVVSTGSLAEIPQDDFKRLSSGLKYPVQQTQNWYENYIKYKSPVTRVLMVYDVTMNLLIGVAPIQLEFVRGTRFWQLRKWVPLAKGPSDFYDFMILPEFEIQVAEAIADWFFQNGSTWDYLDIGLIPDSSASRCAVSEAFRKRGYHVHIEGSNKFYKINTTTSWETYEAQFLRKKLADLHNRRNRLTRLGIELHVRSIYSNIEHYLPAFFRLYDERREKKAQKASFTSPEMKAFLVDVIKAHEAFRGVRLSLLEDQNECIWAYQLDWLYNNISYHYIPVFDEQYASYSPGKILLYETIKSSFEDPEIREFNFMRGESAYKKQFANATEDFVSLKITNTRSLRLRAKTLASELTDFRDRIGGAF